MKIANVIAIAIAVVKYTQQLEAGVVVNLALSPWVSVATKRDYEMKVRDYILRRAVPGARVRVIDGWEVAVAADCEIPKLTYESPAARAQQKDVASALRHLHEWCQRDQAPGTLVDTAALKAPEVLMTVEATEVVVLVGSAVYRNTHETTFNFTDGRYPSDGHLACTLTESPLGCSEKKNRLTGLAVHWITPSNDGYANDLHKHRIGRFWVLWVHEQGGYLESFSPDFDRTLTKTFTRSNHPYLQAVRDPEDQKVTFHTALQRSVPQWILSRPPIVQTNPPTAMENDQLTTNAVPISVQVEPPATSEADLRPGVSTESQSGPPNADSQPSTQQQAVGIIDALTNSQVIVQRPDQADLTKPGLGIAWGGKGVDLDLYVKARPNSPEISFRRDRTPEGRLFKDERTGNVGAMFEYVELDEDFGPESAIYVNLYAGHGPISCQVVFWNAGEVRVGNLELKANRGNRGTGSRSNNGCWVKVDLSELRPCTASLVASKPNT